MDVKARQGTPSHIGYVNCAPLLPLIPFCFSLFLFPSSDKEKRKFIYTPYKSVQRSILRLILPFNFPFLPSHTPKSRASISGVVGCGESPAAIHVKAQHLPLFILAATVNLLQTSEQIPQPFLHWQADMESGNGLSNLKNFGDNAKYFPLSPFSFLHAATSYSNSSPIESRGNLKSLEGINHHQRCSSESFLIEEQPSWLDDLLNDSETPFHRGHRRSASDSYAYLGQAAETFTIEGESEYINAYFGTSTRSQNLVHYKDVDSTSIETKGNLLAQKNNQESEEVVSSSAVEHSKEESSSQNVEGSADKAGGSQVKTSGSRTDSKRSKQHNAHRSRVRKLQYIAHLERTLQILKAEGSEVSAELEFVEQQNIILTMENRALRQRLESISQEQLIKHWEQGMLEREIGRLQYLHNLQKQQQMQLHHQHQHNQNPKQRRNRSRDLDHQVNNTTSMKNKDASSSKGSVNGSVRV